MALSLAKSAERLGEVPVGALVLSSDQKVLASGFNRRETDQDPSAHAELLAIREACQRLKSWRLVDCSLYVTLEPCLMCAGIIYQARLKHIIFGALDPKNGAFGSLYNIHEDRRLNHQPSVLSGVQSQACSHILSEFFRNKRIEKKSP